MQQEELSSQNYNFSFWGGVNNTYSFQTENGIVYEVKLKPTPYLFDNPLYAANTYELSIIVADNPTGRSPIFDTKVSRTIAAIFEDFYLSSNDHLLIYICESADKRQNIRKTKFDRWFEHFAPMDYNKYDGGIQDSDGEIYPVSLILKDNNPHKAAIIVAFIDIIAGYNQDK
ncbi:DUF6169 family protein [Runella limosa]|uniref:DUF6169 family protein n=1 Tax=Runella limosa TaxID=370978 RepID=UPI0003FC3890|nr:DUF6169 family protein [Runella limosa]